LTLFRRVQFPDLITYFASLTLMRFFALRRSMRRRDFISLVGATAATWPLAARAQQAEMPVVGFVHGGSPDARRVAAFRKGLNETGYVEGQNVTVEYHLLDGHYDRLPSLMADLVRRRVAVFATPGGNLTSQAAKAASTTIPIVFGVGTDPVKLGLFSPALRGRAATRPVSIFSLKKSRPSGLHCFTSWRLKQFVLACWSIRPMCHPPRPRYKR
jgi:ABC transporter substrate binding protein